MEVVNMLNDLYERFDEKTTEHDVYKVGKLSLKNERKKKQCSSVRMNCRDSKSLSDFILQLPFKLIVYWQQKHYFRVQHNLADSNKRS